MYQVQPLENSEEAIKRVILEEIDGSVGVLTDSEVSRDEAVHEARKSMKRIRALLRLVREEIGEEVFDRENVCYRDAARKLAPLRDSAVMVETLDLIHSRYEEDLTADTIELIREKLVERKEEMRGEFLQQKDVFPAVVKALLAGRERVDELPIGYQDFRAYDGGMRRVYRRGRDRMMMAYEDNESPEKFHDWRKRVKYLWHHIEFFQPLWPVIFEPLANELHQLSDYLGEANDAAVLEKFFRNSEADFPDDTSLALLIKVLKEYRKNLERAAQPLGYKIYAEKPRDFVKRIEVYWEIWKELGAKAVNKSNRHF